MRKQVAAVTVAMLTSVAIVLAIASLALSATYYLSPTGDDRAAGTISAPFKTFKAAETKLLSGDTVVVRGGLYTLGCVIDVPNTTWQRYKDEIPLIDGAGVRPGKEYAPLVTVSADGVIWDGVNITGSTGYNMHIKPSQNASFLKNISILNSQIYDSNHQNLVVEYTDNFKITNCYFSGGNYTLRNGVINGASVVIQRSKNAVISNTTVCCAQREGLIFGPDTHNSVVEFCKIYGNRMAQLYFCNSSNCIARYNLIYGWLDENDLSKGLGNAGAGIVLGSETKWGLYQSEGHEIYSNHVTGCKKNLSFGIEQGSTPLSGCSVAYNSFVNAQINNPASPSDWCNIYVGEYTGTGNKVTHNMIVQDTGKLTWLRSNVVEFDYNAWSAAPSANAVGQHDYPYLSR
jgi:hypothetical protein